MKKLSQFIASFLFAALEEAMDTVTTLEQDLTQAKSEAARNKEECKSVRKRLVGCHFHYKQLQEQYSTTLKVNDDLDRQVQKARKHALLRQAQEESCTSDLEDMRRHRRVSEEQVERLTKENEELHSYCEGLLKLATKSVDAAASVSGSD
jgi:chromosome segregation ATPase